MVQIWILASPSTKTTRNRVTLLLLVGLKNQSALSTIIYTKVNITNISYSIVKWISKLTHLDLKQNKGNHTPTLLNALTVKMIIKLTLFFALSRSIASIENSTWRSIRKSGITGTNQFSQLWTVFKYKYKRNQNIFSKHL